MPTVTDYLDRARECSALADKMNGDNRKAFQELADAWLQLAQDEAKEALTPSGKSSHHPPPR